MKNYERTKGEKTERTETKDLLLVRQQGITDNKNEGQMELAGAIGNLHNLRLASRKYIPSTTGGTDGANDMSKVEEWIELGIYRDTKLVKHRPCDQIMGSSSKDKHNCPAQTSDFPECDKMHSVQQECQTLTRFVDWLTKKEFRICDLVESTQDFTCDDCDTIFTRKKSEVGDGSFDCPMCGEDLGKWDEDVCIKGGWFPISQTFEKLFAEFLEIDLDKVEEERRQILEDIRKKNQMEAMK